MERIDITSQRLAVQEGVVDADSASIVFPTMTVEAFSP